MKYALETYGCSTNKADSEAMAGLLAERGLRQDAEGGLLIVNTCTVKKPTETKILRRLRELEKSSRRVIVTGCLPLADPGIAERFPGFSFLGTNVEDVVIAAGEALAGRRFVKITAGDLMPFLPRVRVNPLIGIVPVSQGCLGSCAYCIVKNVRRQLRSYPVGDIKTSVEKAVLQGVRELWLTSQDTGAYGSDINDSLPNLLCEICSVEGDYMVRVGMMNPNHVLGCLDELIAAYQNERLYKFLHIPVQSGDDGVLRDMNRRYSVDDFKDIVKAFRRAIPEITIATDVICGFPTESEAAFQASLDLVREIRPDVLNVSRFWPMRGTMAEKMTQLPGRVTNERSRRMVGLFRKIALERNQGWVGWSGRVLVLEKGTKDGTLCARNYAYKQVVLESGEDLIGKSVDVRIIQATRCDLRGELI